MTGVPIQQMADRVAQLMQDRLNIPGQGLTEKLRRGGSRLPRRVRAAAKRLDEAATMARNPKHLMQVDHDATTAAYDICVRYLGRLNATERRITAVLDFAARVAFALLVVGGLLFIVLRWRGFL